MKIYLLILFGFGVLFMYGAFFLQSAPGFLSDFFIFITDIAYSKTWRVAEDISSAQRRKTLFLLSLATQIPVLVTLFPNKFQSLGEK